MIKERTESSLVSDAYLTIGIEMIAIETARMPPIEMTRARSPKSFGPRMRAPMMLKEAVRKAPTSVPAATCVVLKRNFCTPESISSLKISL